MTATSDQADQVWRKTKQHCVTSVFQTANPYQVGLMILQIHLIWLFYLVNLFQDLDAVMKRQHSTANTSQDFPEKEARKPKRFFRHCSSWKLNIWFQAKTFSASCCRNSPSTNLSKFRGVAPGNRRGKGGEKRAEGVREKGKARETLAARFAWKRTKTEAKGQHQKHVSIKHSKFWTYM